MATPKTLPTSSISGLEIFATGKHNGDVYSESDLDQMIAAFDKVGFQPQIKAGHADAQEDPKTSKRLFGEPSLGTVQRIYRKGQKLLADVVNIPARFAALIKAGSYRRVSAEIYWGYKQGEVTYPRVLKAVSFLGSDVPALTSLTAIESLFNSNVRVVTYSTVKFDSERSYGMENQDFGELLIRYNARDPEAEAQVDALVRQRMAESGSSDYSAVLYSLRDEARTKRYAGEGPIGRPKEDIPARYASGVALDKRAKELVLARGYSYNAALRAAMSESPSDAEAYGGHRVYANTALTQLTNACSGHTLEDGSWDWSMALQAARQVPEVVQEAARMRLEELTDRMVALEGLAGSDANAGGRAAMRRRIGAEYDELSKAALDGSAISETALRQILWTKSK